MKIFGIILIGAAAFYLFNKGSSNTYDHTANVARVSGSGYSFRYQINDKTLHRKVMLVGTRSSSEGGSAAMWHLMPTEQANKFRKQYSGSGQCPAGVLNQYAYQKQLIPASDAIRSGIAKFQINDYLDMSTWQEVSFSGHCVKTLLEGENKGAVVKAYKNAFDNCRMFWLTGLN